MRGKSPPDRRRPGSDYVDTLVILPLQNRQDTPTGRFLNLPLARSAPTEAGHRFWLQTPDGERLEAVSCGSDSARTLKLYLTGSGPLDAGIYHLFCQRLSKAPFAKQAPLYPDAPVRLANARLDLRFRRQGKVAGIWLDGMRMADGGSLMPYVHYADRTIAPEALELKEHDQASATLTGYLIAPQSSHRTAGKMAYTYTLVEQTPYLRVHGSLRYPGHVRAGHAEIRRTRPDAPRGHALA